jgi:hypothetical protein
MLSVDPDVRPHATDARGFRGLNSTQTKRKEPLSAVPDVVEATESADLVSRVSQILRAPFKEVMEVLSVPGRRIEKLIFALAKKKLSVLSADPLFRGAWRSLPSSGDRTIREPFAAAASDLFKQLHAVLMKERCCVSSPIVPETVIVPMKEPADVRLSFSCVDDVDSAQSVLTLMVREDTVEFAQRIMAQMRACMPPAS